MTTPSGWLEMQALLAARRLEPAPKPEPPHTCAACQAADAELAALVRGLERVVTAPRRPPPAIVCDCD
jgi:hypothetical protein